MSESKHIMVNEYLKSIYSEKVYRLSLNGGMSCPNRDGKLDTRGCIFCSAGGSGDFAESAALPISEQIENGKKRVVKKAPKCRKFIAYFQAYTNTYGPVDYLRRIFTEAINHPDVVILSIGTRPDCIDGEILDLLDELNQIKPVWVELGLQTMHERTAQFIRRGYPLSVYDQAVSQLQARGIGVITHLILGLPGESPEDIYETVKHVGDLSTKTLSAAPMFGVKLQLLHILKGTDLATYYEEHPFHIYTLEEYCEIVDYCIDLLPANVIIHRITGDGPKSLLIEPTWSADKKVVMNTLNKYLSQRSMREPD